MKPSKRCTSQDKLSVDTDVSSRQIDGEWVILDLRAGNYYGLDEVGGAVWSRLHAGLSLQQIATQLTELYDAPPDAILNDVIALVDELLEWNLVRVAEK